MFAAGASRLAAAQGRSLTSTAAAATGAASAAAATSAASRRAALFFDGLADDDRLASAVGSCRRLFSSSSSSSWAVSHRADREDEENTFDVAIVGAGMVGLALAGELAHNPATRHLRVALADANPAPDPTETLPAVPGLRVSTLTPASISALRRAGAWRDGRRPRARGRGGGGRRGGGSGSDGDGGGGDSPPPLPLDLATVSEPFHSMQVWDEAGGCVRYGAEDGLGGGGGGGGGGAGSARRRSGGGPASSPPRPPPPRGGGGAGPPMGSVAENEAIVKSLLAAVRASPAPPTEFLGCGGLEGLSLPREEEPASPSSSPSSSALLPLARLSFSSSFPPLSARLVVGADGARSAVRALSGIRDSPWGRDYAAAAVVATVRLEEGGGEERGESGFGGNGGESEESDVGSSRPSTSASASSSPGEPHRAKRNVAWQRFLSTGPLALLPLRDSYWSVVWSTTPQHARELSEAGARSPEEFAAAVDRALRRSGEGEEARGGEETAPPPPPPHRCRRRRPSLLPARVLPAPGAPDPRSFPLRRSSAGTFVLPRLALVGDAAHSVHPLGGQGVNLGLGDASRLASFLAEAASVGADPGADVTALERGYGGPRRLATEAMGAALDGLQRVFGPQRGALAEARAAALAGIDGSGPLRSAIVRYAMGL